MAKNEWTAAQGEAAAQWAAEMLDPTSTPEHAHKWTAFEVGEYHSAGLGAVGVAAKRIDALFTAAGGERVLAAWLQARAEVAS